MCLWNAGLHSNPISHYFSTTRFLDLFLFVEIIEPLLAGIIESLTTVTSISHA